MKKNKEIKIRVSEDLLNRAKTAAKLNKKPFSQWLRECIESNIECDEDFYNVPTKSKEAENVPTNVPTKVKNVPTKKEATVAKKSWAELLQEKRTNKA